MAMLNVSNARHTHSAPYHINVSHLLSFNMYIFHLCTKYPWHDKERGRGKRWEKKYDERLLAINPIFASMNIYFRLSPNKLCTVHCAFNLPIRWFCGWFDDHTILYGLCWMSQPINETKKKKNEKNWRTKKSNQKANLSSELTSQAELRLQYYHPSLMNKLSMNDIKIRNVHPLPLERGCCAALGCARTCAISANVTLHESHAQNCEKDIAKSNRFDLLFYSSSSDCCLFPLGYRSFVRSIF